MDTQNETMTRDPAVAPVAESLPDPNSEEVTATVSPADETPVPSETDEKLVEIIGVGFRSACKTYYFSPKGVHAAIGDAVIVDTASGPKMGKVTISNRTVPEKELVSPLKDIVRVATKADLARHEDNLRLERHAAEVCREKICRHKLEMNLTSVEYTFDNSKLIFYFTAENRVDFRELVKDLASVFKTRIELRQIGIRDEAKMMGGFGVCGRPFCCSSFLADFVQVSIKMAKEQNFSLNSSKISGACGRLMCCLRYEHDTYEEAIKATPSVGSVVSTPDGLGVVSESRPLAGAVKVRLDNKNEAPHLYACADIRVLRSKGKGGLQPDDAAAAEFAALAAERDNAEKGVEQNSAANARPQTQERRNDRPRRTNINNNPSNRRRENPDAESKAGKTAENEQNSGNQNERFRPRRNGGNRPPRKPDGQNTRGGNPGGQSTDM